MKPCRDIWEGTVSFYPEFLNWAVGPSFDGEASADLCRRYKDANFDLIKGTAEFWRLEKEENVRRKRGGDFWTEI